MSDVDENPHRHSSERHVEAIDVPVIVANGDSDPMILPRYSYLLAGLLAGARLKIYPDSGHGFLFQHHSEFAVDVNEFLGSLREFGQPIPCDPPDVRLGIAHSGDAKAGGFRAQSWPREIAARFASAALPAPRTETNG